MPARRYSRFYEQSLTTRCRALKKHPRGRDIFVFLILLAMSLVVVFFFSPLAAPTFNNLKSLKTVMARALKVDYVDFIGHALPGMDKNVAVAKTDDFFLDETLVEVDPKVFLHNELAGFKISENARYYQSSSADGKDALQQEGKEAVSFLLNRVSENIKEKPFSIMEEKPQVLIYHTHASESFIPLSGQAFINDPELTVISLGAYFAELLENRYAISVLHHREFYDTPRHYAYEKVRSPIEQLLKENPQIQVVLDFHRDGVSRQITTASVAGKDTAKILFVVGSRHEGWPNNMRFALFLEKELNERYPGLSRGIRNHAFVYNQDLHPRSLIVEIGGHENTREEIRRSVSYFAEVLAAAFQ